MLDSRVGVDVWEDLNGEGRVEDGGRGGVGGGGEGVGIAVGLHAEVTKLNF